MPSENTVAMTSIEQLAVVAKSYVTCLVSRMQAAQKILAQFGRPDFKIEIVAVNDDGIVFDYNGVDVEYEESVLLYHIPVSPNSEFMTADCYLESYHQIVEAYFAGKKTETSSEEMSDLRKLSKELFNLVNLRGDKILAPGLNSKIEISGEKIAFDMMLEVGESQINYLYVIEGGKAKETISKFG